MPTLQAHSKAGFTLIEVMIAMTLLAILSIAIYQATVRSFTVNHQLTAESSDYVAISAALAAINQDITQMYTPVIGTESQQGAPATTQLPSIFWSAPIRADGLRRSHFKGSSDKITFVANNNLRFERDLPQSDFLKITWEIEQNKSGAYSLYRTADWDAFNYEDTKSFDRKLQRVAVINNLSSGKFGFYRQKDKSWTDNWDSEGSFVTKEARYPEMVSLKMEVPDPTNNATNQTWESNFKPNLSLNSNGQILPSQPQALDTDAIPNPQ